MALTATDLFNDATTREIGGVGPDQVNLIVSDLIGVQQMLQAAVPTINNLSDLHTQVIINQLNEEIASIENANFSNGHPGMGTNLGQFVGVRSRYPSGHHRLSLKAMRVCRRCFNPTPLPALNSALHRSTTVPTKPRPSCQAPQPCISPYPSTQNTPSSPGGRCEPKSGSQ